MYNKQFKKQNEMSTGKILLGVLAGAAAGAALGILFAPDKGSATRKKIMDMADDLGGGLKEKINDGLKTFTDQYKNVKQEAKELADDGKSKLQDGFDKFKNKEHNIENIANS